MTSDGPWSIAGSADLSNNDYLSDVTCPAPDDCWAVGASNGTGKTLIEQDAGAGWGVVFSPDTGWPASWLNSVACTGNANCWAVGGLANGSQAPLLIEQYDGTSWTNVTIQGSLNDLFDVTCVSASECWAVGDYYNGTHYQTLVYQYNGSFWSNVITPNGTGDNALFYVRCVNANDCWAVGNSSVSSVAKSPYQTLIEQYNGSTWTIVSSPNVGTGVFNVLGAVTCTSATNCWANGIYADPSTPQGYFRSLMEQYNGSTWTIVSAPSPGYADVLNSLACSAAADCWSVGKYWPYGSSTSLTVIEQNTGSGWFVVASPNGDPSVSNVLGGMTCDGTVNCWSVGYYAPSVDPKSGYCITCRILIEQSVQANAPPVITSLTPAAGPIGGGQVVTVSGYGFIAGMTATLGGTSVAPANLTPTTFTFTTPAHAAGYVAAQATDGNGSSLVDTNTGYIYVGATSYHPLTPFRILDTRPAYCVQCGTGSIYPSGWRTLQITGYTDPHTGESVPASAAAVVLNVTAVGGSSFSLLTVWPHGTGRPLASNLNFTAGGATPNLVTVTLGQSSSSDTQREVDIFNALGTLEVVGDVEGYFSAPSGAAGEFHAMPPLRVCDSRAGQPANVCNGNGMNMSDAALGPGQSIKVNVTGKPAGVNGTPPTIPSDGTGEAAVLNLTAVSGSSYTYLSVFPTSADGSCAYGPGMAPPSSTINVGAGIAQANRVFAQLGPDTNGGPNIDVCVYNSLGTINFVLDANGWFGSAAAAVGKQFQPIGPSRLCDTRAGQGTPCSGHTIAENTAQLVAVTGQGGVPSSGPVAIIANLTAVSGTYYTFLAAYPNDVTRPNASDLNVSAHQVLPNLVVVQLSTGEPAGSVDIYNSLGSIDAILDVGGWFQ